MRSLASSVAGAIILAFACGPSLATECGDWITTGRHLGITERLYAVARTETGGCKVAVLKLGKCSGGIIGDHGSAVFGCTGGFSGHWDSGRSITYYDWEDGAGKLPMFDPRGWNGPLTAEGATMSSTPEFEDVKRFWPNRIYGTRPVGTVYGDDIEGNVATTRYRTFGGMERAFVAAELTIGSCLKLSAFAWTSPKDAAKAEQSLLSGLQRSTMVPASDREAAAICNQEVRIEKRQ